MNAPLSASAELLLPSHDAAPKCSSYTKELGVDPGGTAIGADAIVLVDVPTPWPKPVFEHPSLAGLSTTMTTSLGSTRVLATVPAKDREPGVTAYWRLGVKTLTLRLSGTPQSCLHDLDRHQTHGDVADNALLICTQGSHDVCCGTEGTRLAVEAEAAFDGVAVHRVSHTGGHRFAPAMMTIPNGRSWAFADLDLARAALELTDTPAEVADRCRGSWIAEPGPSQMAERAVFATQPWSWDDETRTVRLLTQLDSTTVWEVSGESKAWRIVVRTKREVPTISCRAVGGLPAKRAFEFEVVSVDPM